MAVWNKETQMSEGGKRTRAAGRIAIVIGMVALAVVALAVASGAGTASAQERRIALSSQVALTAGTNVLDQPAADGSTIITLPANAQGVVLGGPFNAGDWYWVDFVGGTRGYVQGRVLALVDDRYTPVPSGTAARTSTATATRTPAASVTRVVTATVQPTATPGGSVLGKYAGLWLGELNSGGNVRTAPGTENTRIKTWPAGRRVLVYEQARDRGGDAWYRVSEPPEQTMWMHSDLIDKVADVKFEAGRFTGKWINVNISQQIVTAYDGARPVMVTLASTGTTKDPTEIGVWRIYWRLPKQDMEGGNLASGDYYSLKDVPYPQYFHTSGEGFHGTYWHDDFGHRRSHGCVNLSTPMSEWLYGWANIGTTVWVHN
jgi:hypothetical protein